MLYDKLYDYIAKEKKQTSSSISKGSTAICIIQPMQFFIDFFDATRHDIDTRRDEGRL